MVFSLEFSLIRESRYNLFKISLCYLIDSSCKLVNLGNFLRELVFSLSGLAAYLVQNETQDPRRSLSFEIFIDLGFFPS